ncbi:MAG: metallophosphoesterase [Amphiplicatus sp.]
MTDIHLPIAARPALADLLSKRALGYLSWIRKRARRHNLWASDAVAADLRAQGCEAALISGDIVNLALPDEFARARAWLDRTFDGLPVYFAPGNHDAYVKTAWAQTLGRLGPQMVGRRPDDPTLRPPQDAGDFPYVARLGADGEIALIVANSSPPTAPGLATGALGRGQIERIEAALADAGRAGRLRILMLHHPLTPGVVSARKALADAAALRAAIARAGVDLVLHGHAHFAHLGTVETPQGPAPVLGGGAASHPDGDGRFRPGRYNLIDIERTADGGWSIHASVREIDPESRSLRAVERHIFSRPAPAAPEAGRRAGRRMI